MEIEIPKYAEQGQTRGRKPKRDTQPKGGKRSKAPKKTKGDKVGGKKNGGKGKKGLQGKRKAKVERAKRAHKRNAASVTPTVEDVEEKTQEEAKVEPVRKRKTRRSKVQKPEEQVPTPPSDVATKGSEGDGEFSVPDDAIEAPPSMSGNSIYSSAYRKAQKLGGSGDDWRRQGKHASWLFRTYNKISPSLSGNPRGPKSQKEGSDPKSESVENTPAWVSE